MRTIAIILIMAAFAAGIQAQELDSLKAIMENKNGSAVTDQTATPSEESVVSGEDEVNIKLLNKEVVKVIDNPDSTYVKVGDKGMIQVTDQPDSTRIRVGDKEISIVERNDKSEITLQDVDEDHKIRNPRFRGHWAGVEWGLNNFLDDAGSISREGENAFMDLNTSRSWTFNMNFAQYSLGFGTSHAGLVTGLGLEYNNYFFDGNNSIAEVGDFVVVDSLEGNIAKSKLTSLFLRVPLVLEVQFPKTIRSRRVFISAGLVTGIKLASHTKVVTKGDNGKIRDKNNDDFNISPFRYGLTARIGYGNICVFGDYYFTPEFVAGKGPELYPFTIGLAANF
jgi:hypothetical protein